MSRVPGTRDPAYQAGGFALLLALAGILGALFMEYVWELAPCPLCLQQRWAYYAGIPGLFLALVLASAEHKKPAALLFFAVSIGFLANSGLGIYHSGVEWKFWPGPDTCAQVPGELKPLGKALLGNLEQARVVRCDVAPIRILGLSLAGWNAILSFVIFVAALQAAFAATAPRTTR